MCRSRWRLSFHFDVLRLALRALAGCGWLFNGYPMDGKQSPVASPVHYGVVHYGRDPKKINETAKNPIRLNPYHSSTVFRVNLCDLPPKTTFYYTVEIDGF